MQGAATAFSLWLCLHYKVARAYGVLGLRYCLKSPFLACIQLILKVFERVFRQTLGLWSHYE